MYRYSERKNSHYVGEIVRIRSSSKGSSYKRLIGDTAEVIRLCGSMTGVLINNNYNPSSRIGAYWFDEGELVSENDDSQLMIDTIDNGGNNKMMIKKVLRNYNKVATVAFDGYPREYFFALYDTNDTYKVGDLVLISINDQFKLVKINRILELSEFEEESGISITNEIITRIDLTDYNNRLLARQKSDKIYEQMMLRRKELEARKNDDYYASMDTEYAEMLKSYRALNS